MTHVAVIEGTTQHERQWSSRGETPDLMTVFTDAIEARKAADVLADPDAPRGFDAVFAWAMRQDFDADHAARVRREAWGRHGTQ